MWHLFYVIVLYANLGKILSDDNGPLSVRVKEEMELKCKKGTMTSSKICIPKGYIKEEVPEVPTVVNTKIEINNIREVNDKKMQITLDFYQEMSWIDNRINTRFLRNGVAVLNNNFIDKIWKPDLWINNLFDFRLLSVLEPTGGLIIVNKDYCESVNNCARNETEQNTLITYNMEAQATIYCNFHFVNYPMDIQYCEFLMDGSYPYPNIVDFSFELGLFGVTNKNSNIDDFKIEITFKDQGNRTGIHSIIKLERLMLPFIIKYYLPCIAIITVSLLSFLIPMTAIPARVALLVTQFLTLTNILIAQEVIRMSNAKD